MLRTSRTAGGHCPACIPNECIRTLQMSTLWTSRTARGLCLVCIPVCRCQHTMLSILPLSTNCKQYFAFLVQRSLTFGALIQAYYFEQASILPPAVCWLNDLPAEALDNVFEHLDYFTGLHLASTCKPCTTAFSRYRLILSQRACLSLLPVLSASLSHHIQFGPDLDGRVHVWWGDISAIQKIYWLSREANMLEDMWSATWSRLFSSIRCGCCDGQLCHGLHPPTNRHACFQIAIMITSNTMMQLPMTWLYTKFLGIANSTLVQALGTRFDQFAIEWNMFRPGRLKKEAWKISPLTTPSIAYTNYSLVLERVDVTFEYAQVSGQDWYEHIQDVEGDGLFLSTDRQVLTVTGPWYKSTNPVKFGNVVGDCLFKPIEDREFTDKWEIGWEYDERNYIQHHEVVHKADDTEYERIKAKRNKANRRDQNEATWGRDEKKKMLTLKIACDLEEYYEECKL